MSRSSTRVATSQRWPPRRLAAGLEASGVESPEHIADGPARSVVEHEGVLGLQHAVGRSKDLAEQAWVLDEVGGITPGRSRAQADLIERAEVVGSVGTDVRHDARV